MVVVVVIAMDHRKVRKDIYNKNDIAFFSSIGSYGNNSRFGDSKSKNGNSLLDDLDSFVVGPLRPGPTIIKNFYTESPLIINRPQVRGFEFHRMNQLFVFNRMLQINFMLKMR